MTIDTQAIGLVSVASSTYRDASDLPLRSSTEATRQPADTIPPNEAATPASALVAISAAARSAAQDAATDNATANSSAINPEPSSRADSAEDYLEQLLIHLLSARNTRGISAADLQAARASDANSDLLLTAIEAAARRAGFIAQREVPHVYDGADQTTFQARGVIRTAHD